MSKAINIRLFTEETRAAYVSDIQIRLYHYITLTFFGVTYSLTVRSLFQIIDRLCGCHRFALSVQSSNSNAERNPF